jgi:FMN-dependent NADH-azoreductase
MVTKTRSIIQYNSTDEDKEWLHRSLVGNILPNVDVATLEAMVLKSSVKAVSFRFLGASQVIIIYVDQLASVQEQRNKVSSSTSTPTPTPTTNKTTDGR